MAKRKTASLRAKSAVKRQPKGGVFTSGLRPNAANFATLAPLSSLPRSAAIHPDRIAVIHGKRHFSYRELYERARRLTSALSRHGIRAGDTVSVMLPNVPAMVEAHYGVPMLGAVLHTINTRLDAPTIGYIFAH